MECQAERFLSARVYLSCCRVLFNANGSSVHDGFVVIITLEKNRYYRGVVVAVRGGLAVWLAFLTVSLLIIVYDLRGSPSLEGKFSFRPSSLPLADSRQLSAAGSSSL